MELLIVIAVLGLVVMLALPSFRTWLNNTQIRTMSDSVLNGLQLARAEAVKLNSRATFALNGNSWSVTEVVFDQTTGMYKTVTVQSRNAAQGTVNAVVTATPTGTTAVAFNGLGRSLAGAVVTFNVSNPTGGTCQGSGGTMRCLNIVVQTGGQIRMCDPMRASTDPMGC